MSGKAASLGSHLRGVERRPPEEAGLTELLESLAAAARTIARDVQRAGLAGLVGYAAGTNPSGETQKKLDVIAHDTLVGTVETTGVVAAIVSEEIEEGRALSSGERARFILCTDPLDGSSNTDINGAVGTIFGIYPRRRAGRCESVLDEIRGASALAAAGYVLYGPATVLVFTRGGEVNGFTLDADRNEFVLTHPRMKCPDRGPYLSANLGRAGGWEPGARRFVDHLTENDRATGRPYSLRYVGALVADLHRGLLDGGIFLYPADASSPQGKLRLLYECAPLALVVERAGGRASTGRERILDVRPRSLHQRVPRAIGSREDVDLYESMLREGRAS